MFVIQIGQGKREKHFLWNVFRSPYSKDTGRVCWCLPILNTLV
ncbi:uncharacterized protein CCOS01_16459 [Colletotrichum costaricense]|uniref:Uncharacterized protein n=1 Tax=Colletotrichum costaricense TaxID=1209916 RepID=A0AAJ0DS39_9PEZI|nr:uncharacterized protein CCOS01_16459 [Colletotrichum costaricense]KAI3532991.1 hypothetical protein CSPX01_13062 [Colletotrichum filicis]KAK1506407.1 hypothetical protein CCOS01_16459 [Colletotrichum costaricense]